LLRLSEANPAAITAVLAKLAETLQPFYDYQGRLKTLLEKLASSGQRAAVLDLCNRLRDVAGVPELFAKLTTQ
jgi:hypothetical protein